MLFATRFVRGIERGEVTTTVRGWRKPQVFAGRRYSFGGKGQIEILSVRETTLGRLTAAQARTSGLESLEDLKREVQRTTYRPLQPSSKLYLIRFRRVEAAPKPRRLPAKLKDADREILRLIAKHPRVRAADLAAKLGRETLSFKAHVRRLKGYGLTRSLEVGYELTALGKRVLAV